MRDAYRQLRGFAFCGSVFISLGEYALADWAGLPPEQFDAQPILPVAGVEQLSSFDLRQSVAVSHYFVD